MHLVDRFRTLKPLNDQLPLRFSNGSTVDLITTRCTQGHAIPPDLMRGELVSNSAGYELKGVSYCPHCEKYVFGLGYFVMSKTGWFFDGPPAGAPIRSPWAGDTVTPYEFEQVDLDRILSKKMTTIYKKPRNRIVLAVVWLLIINAGAYMLVNSNDHEWLSWGWLAGWWSAWVIADLIPSLRPKSWSRN